jgi:aldehyde dehydrogenase (NAD+)
VESHKPRIHEAVQQDLGRSGFQTDLQEIDGLIDILLYFKSHLSELMADIPKDVPSLLFDSRAYLRPEPYGVALIVGTWNYPFTTALNPLVNAIATGNVALVKPSELAPHCAAVIHSIIDTLDPGVAACVEGGADVAIAVLDMRWDLIVFTGSPEKGRLIAAAAAKNLTPVILELGGKNPVIIDKDVVMDNAVKRIVQGRFMNAGQLCISPDLALVHSARLDEFVNGLKKTIAEFFGPDPKQSRDYSRIINDFHTRRIAKLLEGHGGKVICGGEVDIENRYIAPTVLLKPNKNAPVADEEVFGPILNVFSYDTIEECVEIINSREKPLAVYYFGNSRKNMETLTNCTSSGNITWNDCVVQHACPDLPFGGVGNSGIGELFGVEGFKAMSHNKSVLERGTNNSFPASLRYPPYTPGNQRNLLRVKSLFNYGLRDAKRVIRNVAIAGVVVLLAYKGYLDPLISQASQIGATILKIVKKEA